LDERIDQYQSIEASQSERGTLEVLPDDAPLSLLNYAATDAGMSLTTSITGSRG
jgi:hypothetical protein